jgi:DNA-binding transcriptional regulator YhcF (GntR family)
MRTASEAYNRLADRGILIRQGGVGTFVAPEARSIVESNPITTAVTATEPRIKLDKQSHISLTTQIRRQIQDQIRAGELQPGVRLPPVRELANSLDVGFWIVSAAYTEMAAQGILITNRGAGSLVSSQARTIVEANPNPTRVNIMLEGESRITLVDQIVSQIQEQIRVRSILPEARLPSAAELAGQLGINKPTISIVYERLTEHGILRIHEQGGIFVSSEAASIIESNPVLVPVTTINVDALGVELDGQSARSYTEQIIGHIQIRILEGVLQSRTLLPSLVELANHLGISLHVVQNVYSRLADHGLLISRSGSGTFTSPQVLSLVVENPIDVVEPHTSNIVLNRQSSVSLTDQLVRQLRNQIREGTLPAGTRLPTLKSLASALGISAPVVQRSYRFLADRGILINRRRAGTFVSPEAGSILSEPDDSPL